MSAIATTPKPPYYAVIFTSTRRDDDGLAYGEMAARMEALAKLQPGYLGMEHARSEVGITVSYWTSLESISAWKAVAEHAEAQRTGKAEWYEAYTVRIARVERDYSL